MSYRSKIKAWIKVKFLSRINIDKVNDYDANYIDHVKSRSKGGARNKPISRSIDHEE